LRLDFPDDSRSFEVDLRDRDRDGVRTFALVESEEANGLPLDLTTGFVLAEAFLPVALVEAFGDGLLGLKLRPFPDAEREERSRPRDSDDGSRCCFRLRDDDRCLTSTPFFLPFASPLFFSSGLELLPFDDLALLELRIFFFEDDDDCTAAATAFFSDSDDALDDLEGLVVSTSEGSAASPRAPPLATPAELRPNLMATTAIMIQMSTDRPTCP
jgi:hypothetical protein